MNIEEVEAVLKITFTNKGLIEKALTHRSYLNENTEGIAESNERLEFLGDAVLQFLSSEYIFKRYSDFKEGDLTNLRSKIVNTESLAKESLRLKLGEHLLISRGEKETAKESNYILANTFEATVGAIYLDQGIEVCREFVHRELFYKADKIIKRGNLKDAKSLYQEITQEKYSITPTYKLIEDEGPDHNKLFKVGVYLDKELVAEGEGTSKRKAQQDAAEDALAIENKKSVKDDK